MKKSERPPWEEKKLLDLGKVIYENLINQQETTMEIEAFRFK